ncbi:MAG: hypoxanthine phosphoribosyltransferase, partial [Clostridia bacterium]|nr:hypoxanthine phosphoribosyltransferase [Clostridia bacterium]
IGCDVKGKDVLIAEDIIDTGYTLKSLTEILYKEGAKSVKCAALLDKPERREVDVAADYCCFTIPDAFVIGYGLDYDGEYRSLPYVGVLNPAYIKK